MTKKAYNIDVGDIQVEDDGRTIVLPLDVQTTLGLKINDKIVLKKIGIRKTKTVIFVRNHESTCERLPMRRDDAELVRSLFFENS